MAEKKREGESVCDSLKTFVLFPTTEEDNKPALKEANEGLEPPSTNIKEQLGSLKGISDGDVCAEIKKITDLNNFKHWNKLWEPIEVPPNLSKRQRKRFIRQVLWETKWKPLKRAKEKEKRKRKKLETLGPRRKMLKKSTMASSNYKLKVVLDFSFDDLMSDKDVGKCLKQLNLCYCLNRRVTNPLQLYVTNFQGQARDQMARITGYHNWDVNFCEENHTKIFPKDDLIYFTSDSKNVLTKLDETKVYVIGALVDHNKCKGKTLSLAKEQNISHAQLPIGEFLEMNSRRVLTINHVFEILLHVSSGTSWKEALLKVIPQRKRAVEKASTEDQKY